MDITASTIKYVLFVCNFLFVVSGLVLVIFGCVTIFSEDDASKILEDHDYTIVGVFLVIIGLCIFGVTFFGCWGALYEKYSMLYTYGILLTVLLVLQLIFYGIILYFSKKDCGGQFAESAIEKFFAKYYTQKHDLNTQRLINNFQESHLCCGVKGPDFWQTYGKTFPSSCCPSIIRKCDFSNAYQKGCLNDIQEYLTSKFHSSYIIYSLVIQILVIGSTFYLARELTTHRSDYDAI